MYQLYTDAAVQPTTGDAGLGVLILHNGHQWQFHRPFVTTDNHQAEFAAAQWGFEQLAALVGPLIADTTVLFHTDSQLVYDSLQKQYAKHYQSQVDDVLRHQQLFGLVLNQWVPESENTGAHQLAGQGLHQQSPNE